VRKQRHWPTRLRNNFTLVGAGLLWAVIYGLAWGIAWITFMRTTWYNAVGAARPMPWSEIWTVWSVLNVPLGLAIAAFLRGSRREVRRSRTLVNVVLVLWVPMTLGMFGWAWYESLSLVLIAIDSAVNLIGLAGATLAADRAIGGAR
jgi:hypothetical protein